MAASSGISNPTLNMYARHIRYFTEWCHENGHRVLPASRETVVQYLALSFVNRTKSMVDAHKAILFSHTQAGEVAPWSSFRSMEAALIAFAPSVFTKCAYADCARLAQCKSWCTRHYERVLKYGDPAQTEHRCEFCGREKWLARKDCCEAGKRDAAAKMKLQNDVCYRRKYDRDPVLARATSTMHTRNMQRRNRKRVIDGYGGACACECGCRESQECFLAIDHVNGGGNKHRRELGKGKFPASSARVYALIIRLGFPKDFQLLCHNCNQAKNLGPCPGRKPKSVD